MFVLRSKAGVMIHINNSRRAVYGYDQRVEAFGSKGMIISNNQTPTSVEKFNELSTSSNEPILHFFIERYAQAYRDQFNHFLDCVKNNTKPSVGFQDGRNALLIANAAYQSNKEKRTIQVNYE